MRYTKTILIVVFSLITSGVYSQPEFKTGFEISFDIGLSNDSYDGFRYASSTLSNAILVDKRNPKVLYNYNVAYSRFFSEENAIKLSFGQTAFGFNYSGNHQPSGQATEGSMKITLLEFGLSYVNRSSLKEDLFLLIEPGLRYHSDGSISTDGVRFSRKDVFAFSGYTGLEFPIKGDKLFANAGLQVKFPLQSYSNSSGMRQPYYPYFVGIRLGMNVQFFLF